MPYVSTVPGAKGWLFDQLVAADWGDGPAPWIMRGPPTESEDVGYDSVYFGPTEVPENQLVTLGATRADETYQIRLFVDVYRYGDDEWDTELRAWQLLSGVIGIVMADKTLGGAVNRTTGVTFNQVNPAPDTQNQQQYWRTLIQINVAVVGLVFT